VSYKSLTKRLHPDFWHPQRKPVGPVEIDWSHPLATATSLFFRSPYFPSGHSVDYKATRSKGYILEGLTTTNSAYLGTNSDTFLYPGTGDFTYCVRVRRLDTTNGKVLRVLGSTETGGSAYTSNHPAIFLSKFQASSGLVSYRAHNGAILSSYSYQPGEWVHLVYRRIGSTGEFFINGESVGTFSTTEDIYNRRTRAWELLGRTDGAYSGGQECEAFMYWPRGLRNEEIYYLFRNPYAFLRPANDRIWVPVSGGGSVSVTGSGTVNLFGSASILRSVIPALAGGVSLSGLASIASGSSPSSGGEVQLSGAAAVSANKSASVTGSGTLVLDGQAPSSRARSFSASGNVSLSGAAASASAIEIQPTGELLLSGAAAHTRVASVASAGGVLLSGSAGIETFPPTSAPPSNFRYIRMGGSQANNSPGVNP